MERYGLTRDSEDRPRLECPYRGTRLLRHPLYTKGTAFTEEERFAFGLEGLLPHHTSSIEEQERRVYENIARKTDPLEKYVGLAALQDRNERLFYRLLVDHLEEFERILGLGDQGVGGMGIPVGKLALYTAAAGIPPWQTLPLSLDVGTDNVALLDDPLYLGWRARRLRGPEYDVLANVDTRGFVVDDQAITDEHKRPFAWPRAMADAQGLGAKQPRDLLAVVRALKPTVLIGTSGEPGTFSEEVVREMARHVERPLVFPLSNPTSQSEAIPADVLRWTDGRALVATGSPFAPVDFGGRTFRIGQANNVFVFPGVGLGAIASEAREVTENMFAAAAEALAAEVTPEDLAEGSLFPRIARLRSVTARVAKAVMSEALRSGLATRQIEDPEGEVAKAMWEPSYIPLDAVSVARAVQLAFATA